MRQLVFWHAFCKLPAIMRNPRASEGGSIVASLMMLVCAVFLFGAGCEVIYWFFWSQATCGPDIGIGLLLGSFFIVHGKRTLVRAFESVSSKGPLVSRTDVAVLVGLAVVLLAIFARPLLNEFGFHGRGRAHSSPYGGTDSRRVNDDQPGIDGSSYR